MLYDKLSRLNALRVAVIYGIVSVLWIIFSDRILRQMVESQELVARYQTAKGLVFVSLSTLLVYLLVRASRSKLKVALNEKEVLLAEIHHRVKNNLALISSLIQLQAYQEEHTRTSETLLKSVRRVGSIALVHETVYKSESLANIPFDLLVPDLVDLITQHFHLEEDSLTLDARPVCLNVSQAVSCALFLNEALSYACQRGGSDTPVADLHVALEQNEDTVTLHIASEHPAGLHPADHAGAQALELELLQLISQQLDGTMRIEKEDGLRISITFIGDRNPKGSTRNHSA